MKLFNFGGKPEKTNENAMLEPVLVEPGLSVPKAFADHWQKIAQTKLPTIKIIATPEENISFNESSFGALPRFPKSHEYPKDAKGNYMFPLAQIDFSKVPALEGYPRSGFLQIYIAATDDVYGLDFDKPDRQANFRVLYFEEADLADCINDFGFLDETMQSDQVPIYKSHRLSFSATNEYVGMVDHRADENPFKIDDIIEQYPTIESQLEDEAFSKFQSNGHKIGGYAYFTQTDPRSYKSQFKDYLLLLQIDSDDEIMWGDVGVANFFIDRQDLANLDFSAVVYNWDCS